MTRAWIMPALAAAVLALSAAAYVKGRSDGRHAVMLQASEAARQIERELTSKIAALNWELQQAREKRQAMEGELAREAALDPDADRPALGAASLRRIERAFTAPR